MYIPREGLYFHLVSTQTNHRIFSRTSEPNVGLTDGPEYEDQLFSLIHGSSDNSYDGLYAIKSKESGRLLFSRGSDPHVGNIEGEGEYSDNWFAFDEGFNRHASQFRILCPANSLVLFARTAEPHFGNVNKNPVYDDHYFKFAFEDMVVKSVDFDVKLGTIDPLKPQVIASEQLDNKSDKEQSMSFNFSEDVGHTSSFEYTVGFTITLKTTIEAGIPFVVDGKIEVDASVTNQWKFGSTDTFSKHYAASFPVRADPHGTVHATATVEKAMITVPYTITLYPRRDPSVEVQTKGDWKGLTSWNLACKLENGL